MEALDLLASFVDQSDPDTAFANSLHAYQTAEEIRAKYPDDDWLHLTGLIHDIGKVMDHFDQPQVLLQLSQPYFRRAIVNKLQQLNSQRTIYRQSPELLFLRLISTLL